MTNDNKHTDVCIIKTTSYMSQEYKTSIFLSHTTKILRMHKNKEKLRI